MYFFFLLLLWLQIAITPSLYFSYISFNILILFLIYYILFFFCTLVRFSELEYCEDIFSENISVTEKMGGVHFSESVLFREKTRKILQKTLQNNEVKKFSKIKEELKKGNVPLLKILENENNNFYSKMGKDYINSKKRKQEDLKVRQ